MDNNDTEFGIHPLDLFPHNKNLNNNLDSTAKLFAKFDGFSIHPIDLFVNHGNINEEQINNGIINNHINKGIGINTPTINADNIFNQYQSPRNMGINQTQNREPLFNNGNAFNNIIIANKNNNENKYNIYKTLNNNSRINSQLSPIPLENQSINKLIYSTSSTQNVNILNGTPQNIIVNNSENSARMTIIQNEPNIKIINGINQNGPNINIQTISNDNGPIINEVPNLIQQRTIIQNSPNISMDISPLENASNITVQRTIQNIPNINGQSTIIQNEPTIIPNFANLNGQNSNELQTIIQDIPNTTEQRIIINNEPNINENRTIIQTIPKINEARTIILNEPNMNINRLDENINLNYIGPQIPTAYNNINTSTKINNGINYLYKRMENPANYNSPQNNALPLFPSPNNLNSNIYNLNQNELAPNILNKSPPAANNIIPYDCSSYEPDINNEEKQTTKNVGQIKAYLNTSTGENINKTLFHSKSANNFNNLNYQINNSIIEPSVENIVPPSNQPILIENQSSLIIPNMKQTIMVSPLKQTITPNQIVSPVVPKQIIIRDNINTLNTIAPNLSTFALNNDKRNNIIRLPRFFSQKKISFRPNYQKVLYQPINNAPLNLVSRSLSISPARYNLHTYIPNKVLLKSPQITNVRNIIVVPKKY